MNINLVDGPDGLAEFMDFEFFTIKDGSSMAEAIIHKWLPRALEKIADDQDYIWEGPRQEIEDQLIELRDSRISLLFRNNGLVIKEKDSSDSMLVRMGPEEAVSVGLRHIAKDLKHG